MPNVAEILKDHVTLEVRCIDRLYRNAYVPRLQTPGGVSGGCLVRVCHQQIASPARFGQLTTAFKTRLRAWATERDIPWIAFRNGKAVYVNHYYIYLLDPEWRDGHRAERRAIADSPLQIVSKTGEDSRKPY